MYHCKLELRDAEWQVDFTIDWDHEIESGRDMSVYENIVLQADSHMLEFDDLTEDEQQYVDETIHEHVQGMKARGEFDDPQGT